jgi:hypothetical protein
MVIISIFNFIAKDVIVRNMCIANFQEYLKYNAYNDASSQAAKEHNITYLICRNHLGRGIHVPGHRFCSVSSNYLVLSYIWS